MGARLHGPLRIVVTGGPASGKGTQCENIVRRFGVVHLSTGDILRKAVKDATPIGQLVQTYINAGKLVPDSTMNSLVLEHLRRADCAEKGWMLDGYPRTLAQADALFAAGVKPDLVVHLDVPDRTLVARAVGRRMDPETKRIYHVTYNPPKEAEVVERLVQRDDDTEEKVKVRLEQYHRNNSAILTKYGNLILRVDGQRQIAEVFTDVATCMEAVEAGEHAPVAIMRTADRKGSTVMNAVELRRMSAELRGGDDGFENLRAARWGPKRTWGEYLGGFVPWPGRRRDSDERRVSPEGGVRRSRDF